MTNDRHAKAKALLKKYLKGTSSEQEKAWIEQVYLKWNDMPTDLSENEVLTDLVDLQERLSGITRKRMWSPLYIGAAAAILVFLTIGIFSYRHFNSNRSKETMAIASKILPGTNRALLSLDGQPSIELNGGQDGVISAGTSILYRDGTAVKKLDTVQMATLSTPIAGQYQITLPDGTQAWLNALSSITYPTRFAADQRTVSVRGEVYLEVAKNAAKPFIVHAGNQRIQVLGTSFNVDAYGDDGQFITTLSEGRLKVVNTLSQAAAHLEAGQQAIVSDGRDIKVKNVDTESFSSWKDGVFVIHDLALSRFGKQIERWYDISIDMGGFGDIQLSAIIRRDAKLSEVLQAIELKTGIVFTIEGRRVMAID